MLNSSAKLGPYEIVSPIGAGGMGEVYQAHDTKLGRDVAIKVLPEAFGHDPQRLSRFQREAKLLASLNHPNIATIHGLENRTARTIWGWSWSPARRWHNASSEKGQFQSRRLWPSRCRLPRRWKRRKRRASFTAT